MEQLHDMGLKKPLVTIVVVSFNHALYLEQAVESALAIGSEVASVILLDNGSHDGSAEIVRDLASKHNLKFYLAERPCYHPEGFMQIADQIDTDYFIDLSADDVLLPVKLEQLRWFHDQPQEVAVAFSDAVLISKDGHLVGKWSEKHSHADVALGLQNAANMLLTSNHLCTPTAIYRTSIWKRLGGFDTSYFYEDIPYYLNVVAAGYRLAYWPHATLKRRILSESATMLKYASKSEMAENPSLKSTARLYYRQYNQIGPNADLLNVLNANQRNACFLGYQQIGVRYMVMLRLLNQPLAAAYLWVILSPILAGMLNMFRSLRRKLD